MSPVTQLSCQGIPQCLAQATLSGLPTLVLCRYFCSQMHKGIHFTFYCTIQLGLSHFLDTQRKKKQQKTAHTNTVGPVLIA